MIIIIFSSFTNIKNTTKLVKNKRFDNNGFTLVEIIVVLVLIVILASVVVPSFLTIRKVLKKKCAILIVYSWRECIGYI